MLSLRRMVLVLAGGLSVASAAEASSYKVIYTFTGGADGSGPFAHREFVQAKSAGGGRKGLDAAFLPCSYSSR